MWNNLLLYVFLCRIIISSHYEIVYFFFIAFMLIDICIFAVESEHILSRLCVE